MEATDENESEVRRRIEAIVEGFPDRFADEQIDQIRSRISRSIENGAKLRACEMPNGVGPDFDPRALSRE